MAKVKQRKDSKGRVLQKGESQRKIDGMYIYTYVDPYGKRCYVYSKDLFTLREKEQDLIRCQMDGLDFYVGGRATINMAFDRYMSTKYNLRETTRSNYIYMYNRFVRDEFGNRLIADVKYTDVKMFYYHLLNDKNIAVNTLDNIHTIIHPIFDMAVRDDIIRKNPTDGVMAEIKKNSGKNKGIRHALTVEQQKAFIDAIRYSPEYYHWYPLFVTLLGTGMRIGEAIGLRWEDVDFTKNFISVNHTLVYRPIDGKSQFLISTPKTEAGNRQIPLLKPVREALMREYQIQKCTGANTSEIDGYSGFIFTNAKGTVFEPNAVNRAIKRIVRDFNEMEEAQAKAEKREPDLLPAFCNHVLRHTFCTRLCECCSDIKLIQDIMGHKDIQTTLNIYTEVTQERKQETLQKITDNIIIR